MKTILLLIFLASAASVIAQKTATFSIEGHRGARGLVPENTVPSFLKALDWGVDTLELDVVVSRDNRIVVSHEPWFARQISLDKDGKPIPLDKQKEHNLYKMDYVEIRRYDVGSIGHKDFPEQRKMKVHKPLLSEVFTEVAKYVKKNKLQPVRYNIEIKSSVEGDGIFHPAPPVFASMVYDEILKYKMEKHVIVQSFDVRPLQELNRLPVKLPLALLVANKDGIEKNVANLGFQPDTYSPHFSLIDEPTVRFARSKGMRIIPWTINETADMERMKRYNLDGIITDYPNRAAQVFKNNRR